MLIEYFQLAVGNLFHRKLRSWLTVVGVFVGVMAVVTLLSLGGGLENAIRDEFAKAGVRRVIVFAGGGVGTSGPPGYAAASLGDKDVSEIMKVKGVEYAVGQNRQPALIEFRKKTTSALVFAIPQDSESHRVQDVFGEFDLEEGKRISDSDKDSVVVGSKIAYDNFDRNLTLGDTILIEGTPKRIAGIYKDVGDPAMQTRIDVTKDAAKELFNATDTYMGIMVLTKDGENITQVSQDIEVRLRRLHHVKEGEEDFTVITLQQLVESFLTILNIVQTVITGLAAVSLIVGAIGIMNTMYTSVIERTRQIGIMKSIGAKNGDILLLFLIEAGLVGVVGSLVGVLLGFGIAKTVEILARNMAYGLIEAQITINIALGALLFGFFVGCISGYLPAKQASRLQPVDAMRYR
ncbi:MacB-like periplasmic core domain protein [uncultured archaeon]|nr:MacB-like periplasmic core domain protein [uncultured archaeon]